MGNPAVPATARSSITCPAARSVSLVVASLRSARPRCQAPGQEEVAVARHPCRSCSGLSGHLVLDLGNQAACDHFPTVYGKSSDPTYPLQMWLCATCGL